MIFSVIEMECPRCHNTNIKRFYKINGEYYCRNCIHFKRVSITSYKPIKLISLPPLINNIVYHLDFELSSRQIEISNKLKQNYISNKNSLVLAVCGSGKTEIVFEVISYVLSLNKRVCYCVPRKELCIELYERFKYHFRNIDISLVYGGHTNDLDKLFIVCTTHQLYRYEETGFELIILDEADAFPFYNNKVLQEIFNNCIKGNYIKLSATIEESDMNHEELLIMNRRYHGHDLPLPYVRILPNNISILYILHFIKTHPLTLVYVPSINTGNQLYNKLSHFIKEIDFVHSKNEQNNIIIENFKKGKLKALITTTLLERGITIENVQVIVYQASHKVFDSRTLIQISGRVGRKPNAYDGHICFLSSNYSKEMKRCINTISHLNKMNV